MAKPWKNMSSFPNDIIHHFFKVYLPSHCYHNLKIPKTFIQKMNRVVPGESILRDPLGRSWYVEVRKVEDTFYFQSGWREFVEANGLNVGDFMVFRFMGNSVFNVMVFDNSECEKNDNSEVTSDEEEEEEEEYFSSEEDDEDFSIEEEDEEDEEDEEEEDISSATNAFDEPMNPYFIGSVKENRPYHLHIPKAVVDQSISLKRRMILLDPNQNKQWPVRVFFKKDGQRLFAKGWKRFWSENHLTCHDKCIFEFVQDEKSNVIKVKIVRAT